MSVDRSKQLEVAQRSLAKGQYDKAIAAYQQLVAHDPSDVRSWLKIGDLYTRTRRLAEACAAYERVAKHYAERGFFLKSVAVYKQILKLDPARLDAMLQLAQMYEALELVSEALQIYQQAADGYFRQGAEQSALRALSKTCELDPDSIPVRIKYAEALSRVGQLDKAAEAFEVSAVLLKERGRLEDYIKVVERLLYHKPDHQRFARELATIYLSRQDPKRALAKIQLCFKANPKDIETLELLAQAFESLGQRPKTVSVYREIVRLLQESGREDERARVLKLILELDPHDAEARRQLAAYAPPPQAQPTASAPPHVAGRHDTDADLGSDAEMVLSIPPDAESLPPEAVPAPTGPRRAPAKAPPMRHRATSLAPGKAQSVRPRRVSARVRTSAPPDVAKDAQVARFLTEAEVFLRYGLQDKAVEVLETLLEVDPMHRETRTQLVQLYRQTGDDDKAQMHAQVLENLTQPPPAADKPKTTPAPPPQTHGEDDVLILDAGAASEPPDPAPRPARHASTAQGAPPRRPAARPPAARAKRSLPWPARPGATAAPQPPPRRPPLKGAGPTAAARLPRPPAAPTATAPEDVSAAAARATSAIALPSPAQLARGRRPPPAASTVERARPAARAGRSPGDTAQVAPTMAPSPPPAPTQPPVSSHDTQTQPIPWQAAHADPELEPMTPEQFEAVPLRSSEPPPAAAGKSGRKIGAVEEILDECDFFIAQALWDEAHAGLVDAFSVYPDHPLLLDKMQELREAQAEADAAAPAPKTDAAPDKSFDLAIELAAELGSEVEERGGEMIDVESVFAQFKKGVAEQVGLDDTDTHFDLGIAYKEMGLLEDAIREFELSMRNPRRKCIAHTMVGLCRREQGDLSGAVAAFENGLESEQRTEHEMLGLYFELGSVYEELHQLRQALNYYRKVFRHDPTFRDVPSKIRKLAEQHAG